MHNPTSKKQKQAEQLERLEIMQSRLDLMYAKMLHQKNKNSYVIHYARWVRQLSTGRAYAFCMPEHMHLYLPRAVVFEHDERHALMVIGARFIDNNTTGESSASMRGKLFAISVPGGVLCPAH